MAIEVLQPSVHGSFVRLEGGVPQDGLQSAIDSAMRLGEYTGQDVDAGVIDLSPQGTRKGVGLLMHRDGSGIIYSVEKPDIGDKLIELILRRETLPHFRVLHVNGTNPLVTIDEFQSIPGQYGPEPWMKIALIFIYHAAR